MSIGIDVPKAAEYAARFLAHLIDDKVIPEGILQSLHHLCGQGVFLCLCLCLCVCVCVCVCLRVSVHRVRLCGCVLGVVGSERKGTGEGARRLVANTSRQPMRS